MAGHSKWKNIQHRKGTQDAKKGKVFSKLIKEITVAVKVGGEDPEANPRLRAALLGARASNMPKDNVERAIRKASGADGTTYSEINYEGYGPGGVAVFVECATDNPTRTVSNVRSYFNKSSGSLGKDGCLQFVFERKSIFTLKKEGLQELQEDDFTFAMIDAGASDVEFDEDIVTVSAALEDFGTVQKQLLQLELAPEEAGLQRVPLDTKEVDVETFQKVMRLIDRLEEDDDIQKVYHNMEFKEEFLQGLV